MCKCECKLDHYEFNNVLFDGLKKNLEKIKLLVYQFQVKGDFLASACRIGAVCTGDFLLTMLNASSLLHRVCCRAFGRMRRKTIQFTLQ